MPKAESTIQQIEQFAVDAKYGKKKHYNAATRKEEYHKHMGWPVVLFNAFMGSFLFGLLRAIEYKWFRWMAAILSFLAAALSGVSTYFDFAKTAREHKRIASRYLSVAKKCELVAAQHEDGMLSTADVREKSDRIARRLHQINQDAEAYSTSDEDYQKARKGFEEGEEEYLDRELKPHKP